MSFSDDYDDHDTDDHDTDDDGDDDEKQQRMRTIIGCVSSSTWIVTVQ